MTIIAAADGSALGNPGPAGWAWYVDDDCWASGGWPYGTNNMGELMAVLDLLQQTAHVDDELLVYCDSRYVIDSITKWMPGWKRNGWVKKDKKPVLNVDLMKGLDAAMQGRRVRFEWVKGHSGHELNEAADVRANAAAAAYQAGEEPDGGPGFPGAPLVEVRGALATSRETKGNIAFETEEPDLFSSMDVDTRPASQVVIDLERSLLSDEVRTDPAQVAALLDPEWREIGASGREWSRNELLAHITPLGGVDLDVISTTTLAEGLILLVWRGTSHRGSELRSSIWRRDSSGYWRQLFHQGTPEA